MAESFKNAMRAVRCYVAGVVVTGLDFACHLLDHVGGCWLSFGGPFKRLHDWAYLVVNPDELAPIEGPHSARQCGAMPEDWTGAWRPRCDRAKGHKSAHAVTGPGWSYCWIQKQGASHD